jgi:hypothetical protein
MFTARYELDVAVLCSRICTLTDLLHIFKRGSTCSQFIRTHKLNLHHVETVNSEFEWVKKMLALFKVRYRSLPGWTNDNRAEPESSRSFGQVWMQVLPRDKCCLHICSTLYSNTYTHSVDPQRQRDMEQVMFTVWNTANILQNCIIDRLYT